MASQLCTGPGLYFAGVGPNFAPLFLGTTEGEPDFAWDPEFTAVANQIAGKKALDYQYQGMECLISATFSRYNESVLRLIETRAYRATAARGSEPFGAMGAFMQLEGHSFPLWIKFPYGNKVAMAAAGMPAGFRFPVCFDESGKTNAGSTLNKKVSVQIHAQRQLVIANGGFNWLLYDENMAAVANAAIN